MSPLDYCIKMASAMPYERGKMRLYCVVLDRKNRVVSEGKNSYTRSHVKHFNAAKKVGLELKIYCHAESLALIRSRGKGCKLVVARVNSFNQPVNATPCPICALMCKEHGGIISVEHTI